MDNTDRECIWNGVRRRSIPDKIRGKKPTQDREIANQIPIFHGYKFFPLLLEEFEFV